MYSGALKRRAVKHNVSFKFLCFTLPTSHPYSHPTCISSHVFPPTSSPSFFTLFPIPLRNLSAPPSCTFELILSSYNSYFMQALLMRRSLQLRVFPYYIFFLPHQPFIYAQTYDVICFIIVLCIPPLFPCIILPRWGKAGERWIANAWPPSSSHFQ